MKRFFICTLFLTFVICIQAQVERVKDSVDINLEKNFPELLRTIELEKNLNLEKQKNIRTEPLSSEELKRRKEFVRSLEFQMPTVYVGPPTEDKLLGRILPQNNDYTFHDYSYLGNDLSFSSSSTEKSYLTIGAVRMVDLNINYQISEWLSISGGAYGAKYNMYGLHFNDMGFDASVRLKLHDRIYLRAHTLYSINTNDRSRAFPTVTRGMFPQTYYGSGLGFKISDKFGMEAGMVREFNPMTRKWKNRSYIMPISFSTGR